jgi:hypothetical protein
MAQRIIKTAHRIIDAGHATEEPPAVNEGRTNAPNEVLAGHEEVMRE